MPRNGCKCFRACVTVLGLAFGLSQPAQRAWAKEDSPPAPEPEVENSGERPSVRVQRRLELPRFELRNWKGETPSKPSPIDYSLSRYTVVVAMASWSDRSKEVVQAFLSEASLWSERQVQVVGLFTHDSEAEARESLKAAKIKLPYSVVGLTFVSQMLNPKVPTVWVVSSSGQIVLRSERPKDQALQLLRKKLLAWTEF